MSGAGFGTCAIKGVSSHARNLTAINPNEWVNNGTE